MFYKITSLFINYLYLCDMNFKDIVKTRRSHRDFTDEGLTYEGIRLILRAAMMSPTARHRRAWKFKVVADRNTIDQLSVCKPSGAAFVRKAPAVIVVMGEPGKDECWIENCSIAAISMQYQAEEMGLGSCWVQVRGHKAKEGMSSSDYLRRILSVPDNLEVLCMVAIGHPKDQKSEHDEAEASAEFIL